MAYDVLITPASGKIEFKEDGVVKAVLEYVSPYLKIRGTDQSSTIVFGDTLTTGTYVIEFGNTAVPSVIRLLSGGAITANANSIDIGQYGDTVNLNVQGVTYNFPSDVLKDSQVTTEYILSKLTNYINQPLLTTSNVTFNNVTANLIGNASTASKLQTARTIQLTGDATGSASFDGSANISINTALANSGVTAGTYTKVTVDAKGRVTAGTTLSASDIPNLDWSKITTGKPTTLNGYGIIDAYTTTQIDNMFANLSSIYEPLISKSTGYLRWNGTAWEFKNETYALSTHTHNYAGSSSSGGPANSVANSITIKFDNGTTEGTDQYTFNGSVAKTIDIRAGTNVSIAKSAGIITISANDTSVDWSEITNKPSTFTPSSHTHSASDITSGTFGITRGGTNNTTFTNNEFIIYDGTKLSSSGYSSSSFASASHNHSGIYEPVISTGTANKFYAWDKSWKDIDWSYITNKPSTYSPSAHTHAASDITSGEFDKARIRVINSADTRSTNDNPSTYLAGARFDFKLNSTDNLNDGGSYHGVLSYRPYGTGSDWTGGPMYQIGFTENKNLWIRKSTGDTSWSSWSKIWHQDNDGSGSGLDADLLDGQDSSYYLNYNNLTNKPSIGDGTIIINTSNGLSGGTVSFTVNQTGTTTINLSTNATSTNTASTIVMRDASGNFSAGTITANLSGNASTATKLQTARNINGTLFDGSADITTAKWGNARTITIGNTGKSVDGSGNVSWSISEIGAEPAITKSTGYAYWNGTAWSFKNETYSLSNHTHTSSQITDFASSVIASIPTATTASAILYFDDIDAKFKVDVIANSTTQKVEIANNGSLVGTRKRINFIPGTNISFTINDNTTNDRVDITINNTYSYSHPTGFSNQPDSPLTGASVISQITVNSNGHVTGISTRNLTYSDIGAAAASHDHNSTYYTKTEINNFFLGATAISGYNKSNWDTAYTNSHTHSNISNLNSINQNLATNSNVTFANLDITDTLKAYMFSPQGNSQSFTRFAGATNSSGTPTNGRIEVWDRMSISNGHSWGSFPDPGAGGLYVHGILNVGNASNTTYKAYFNGNTYTNGTIYASGDVVAYQSSDIRLKDQVTILTGALNKIDKIHGVQFVWKDTINDIRANKIDFGVIAQELLDVLPDAVIQREDGYYAVNYNGIIALLIQAIKELKTQISKIQK